MRVGRVVAILTTSVSLTFATALLVSAGGCSGSSTTESVGSKEESKKLLEERIKEHKARNSTIKVPKKR
jgi:hypothetical protein